MIVKVEPYESANFVDDFFKQGLKAWSNTNNSRIKKAWVNEFLINQVIINLLLANYYSFFFVNISQFIEDNIENNKEMKTKYSLIIEQILSCIDNKEETDKDTIVKNIRNALAHADYEIYYNENDLSNSYIMITSDRIKGKITFNEMDKICDSLLTFQNDFFKMDKHLAECEDLKKLQSTNQTNFTRSLRKIKLIKLNETMNNWIKDAINNNSGTERVWLFRSELLTENNDLEELNSKQRNIIEYYINYLGMSNFIKCPEGIKNLILNMICRNCFDETININIVKLAFNETFDIAFNKYHYAYDGLAPMKYYGLLMLYAFYNMNYYNELSKQLDENKVIYSKVDLKDIDIIKLDDDTRNTKIKVKLSSYKSQLKSKKAALRKIKNQLQQISGNNNIPEKKKNEIISNLQTQTIEIVDNINDLEKKIKHLEESSSDIWENFNAQHFFNKLRNSISHSRFKIDYLSGLKYRNLGNTILTFWDEKDNKKVFELKIRVDDLIKLFSILISKIKEEVPYFKQNITYPISVINESVIINDKDSYNNSKEKLEQLIEGTNHIFKVYYYDSEETNQEYKGIKNK